MYEICLKKANNNKYVNICVPELSVKYYFLKIFCVHAKAQGCESSLMCIFKTSGILQQTTGIVSY
jgi:hypothetical protein